MTPRKKKPSPNASSDASPKSKPHKKPRKKSLSATSPQGEGSSASPKGKESPPSERLLERMLDPTLTRLLATLESTSNEVPGLLVAGSEPSPFHSIGILSQEPETFGVDFLWWSDVDGGKLWGIQRKTVTDLINSLHDQRLGRELQQGQMLDHRVLMVEGEPLYTMEGKLIKDFGVDFTREAWANLRLSVMFRMGWEWMTTKSVQDSVEYVRGMVAWTRNPDHTSLLVRPKAQAPWGSADSRDFQIYMLQGIPRVGLRNAERIVDSVSGSPLELILTEEELLEIEGIGPKTVEAIARAVKIPTSKIQLKE